MLEYISSRILFDYKNDYEINLSKLFIKPSAFIFKKKNKLNKPIPIIIR